MRSKVAKIITKACTNESQAFKNELKRTWNKVPRPLRNAFLIELKESCHIEKEVADAE